MKFTNMNNRFLSCLVVAILLLFSSCKDEKIHVILLAGQSNMEGAGNFNALDSLTLARIKKISSRVMLSNGGKEAAPISFQYSKHHKEKYGFGERFGPEMMMALDLAEANPDREYLFIKYAQGGTSLYGAWNPNWNAEKADKAENKDFKKKLKLYSLHTTQIKENLERLKQQGKEYEIIAMGWLQGENDAAREFTAISYKENLQELISAYRDVVGNNELPFIIGQINSTYGRFKEGPAVVRKAMEEVAAADNKVGIVKTSTDSTWSDYPKHSDNTHYNTEGQKRLGFAFAEELVRLQD